MCAGNKGTLDDWLEYDWVGAPWSSDSRYDEMEDCRFVA